MATKKGPEKRTFGEITPLATGRYRARYRGPDGERHNAPVTFLSRLDAETWLGAQHRLVSSGDWKPPAFAATEGVKVDEYARTSIARRRLRPGTAALYNRLLRLEILPVFGRYRVRDISTADVTEWYTGMSSRPTQQANAYGLFKSILKDAVDEQIIERNPCRVKGGVNKRLSTRSRSSHPLSWGAALRPCRRRGACRCCWPAGAGCARVKCAVCGCRISTSRQVSFTCGKRLSGLSVN